MFNLNEIIPYFDRVNRKHYLGELLWDASTPELHQFKKEVKAHQKKSKFIQDLHYMPGMSVHDTIIAAIDFELLKRSKWHRIYKLILPARKIIVSWFSGIDIQEHPYCGTLYVTRQNRKTFLHLSHAEILMIIGKFWLKNWQYLISTAIALAGLYLLLRE